MASTKESLSEITPTRGYTVRRLNAGDAIRVGGMISSVIGDNRITAVLQTGDTNTIAIGIISVFLDRVPRQLGVWVADLIGLTKQYDFKSYRKTAREEAKEENLLPPVDEQVRYYMEEDIVRDLNDSYPADTYMEVLREIMEQDEFDDFLRSCICTAQTARMLSAKFSSLSSESSAKAKKKSSKSPSDDSSDDSSE